jgi:hypothetical protein
MWHDIGFAGQSSSSSFHQRSFHESSSFYGVPDDISFGDMVPENQNEHQSLIMPEVSHEHQPPMNDVSGPMQQFEQIHPNHSSESSGRTRRKILNPSVTQEVARKRPPNNGHLLVEKSERICEAVEEVRSVLSDKALRVQEQHGEKIEELMKEVQRLKKRQKVFSSPDQLRLTEPSSFPSEPLQLTGSSEPLRLTGPSSSSSSPSSSMDPSMYNMVPWVWVLMNLGIQLRMLEVDNMRVRILDELITQVTILAMDYKRPDTIELFSFKRYWSESGPVNDTNTIKCWKRKLVAFFKSDFSKEVTFEEIRGKTNLFIGRPEYELFGHGLDMKFLKSAMELLRPITNRRNKEYGVVANDWQKVILQPNLDNSLYQLIGKPPTSSQVVSVSMTWEIKIVNNS